MTGKLTHERLLEVLHYDCDTGIFTWRVRTAHRTRVGTPAGTQSQFGYRCLCIDGKRYQAHVVAWFYAHGVWPERIVDHRDGVKNNNRLSNLRLATKRQNAANGKPHRDNKTGIKGVTYCHVKKKYRATIFDSGRQKWLGYYDTKEQAGAAYSRAATNLFGNFARTV